MEIQKVFSDMYDEERIYSVLLTEDEMALYQAIFADTEEEGEKKSSGAGKLAAAGAASMGVGLAAGAKNLHTLNKVAKRAGYNNFKEMARGSIIMDAVEGKMGRTMKANRMMESARKNKKVRGLAAAANIGQIAGAGLLIGAGVKAARNKNKNKD